MFTVLCGNVSNVTYSSVKWIEMECLSIGSIELAFERFLQFIAYEDNFPKRATIVKIKALLDKHAYIVTLLL